MLTPAEILAVLQQMPRLDYTPTDLGDEPEPERRCSDREADHAADVYEQQMERRMVA